jgi:serine/threonine protein phosphatase PrpC
VTPAIGANVASMVPHEIAPPGHYQAHGVTHPGLVRPVNEDAFHTDVEHGILVVADGMGGHSSGDLASTLAVSVVCDFLEQSRRDESLTWPFGIDPALSRDGNRIRTAIWLANKRLFHTASTQAEHDGMGTTVVAAVLDHDVLTFASVGDSRVYLWRAGQLEQLTRDDTWVAAVLANDPEADPAMLKAHPMRHVLTEAVGTGEEAAVDVQQQQLVAGDVLLLCTDGLHGAVADADLQRILQGAGGAEPAVICAALLEAALAAGARDNVTAVVLRRL